MAMGSGKLNRLLTALFVCCLLWGVTFAQAAPALASPQPQGYTYAECRDIDADALSAEIDALTMAVLIEGTAGIDISAIVDQQWRELGMDPVVDEAVSAAAIRLQTDADYWSRFLSGWSVDKAQEFATVIAEDAFSSDEFQAALDTLATAVAAQLTAELLTVSARSASIALLCMQTYVGEQYSDSLFALFENEISAGVDDVEFSGDGELDITALGVHNKALTGVSVIIVTELVRRIGLKLSRELGERVAGRVAGRILGRLGSSLVPWVGWLIGASLIAWDIYSGSRGALPQIEESLQSEEVKAAIRSEVSAAVTEGLDEEMAGIADVIATELMDEWGRFCERHPHLCNLPEQNSTFKDVLGATPLEELDKLSELVDLYLQTVGKAELGDALDSGDFENLLAESPAAYEILTVTGSPEEAQAWADLAGDNIEQVVALKLYALTTPAAMTPMRVADLIAVGELDAINTLLKLDPAEMDAILDARPADVTVVAAALPPDELRWLLKHAAQSEKSTLPQLLRDIAGGALTVEALRSPTPVVTASPTVDAGGSGLLPSQRDTDELVESAADQARNLNPILAGSIILLVVLLLLGFAVVIIYSVKRDKHL